jgi:multidrug efflux system outer membrane protein
MSRRLKATGTALALLVLTGCATLSPDGDLGAVQQLAQGKTGGINPQLQPDPQAITDLLAQPLSAEAAVRIALLNSPQLRISLATLGVSDADRVQMGRLPNPHFAIGRFTEGDTREIERMLSFNVLGLLALPWRAAWQGQQHAIAQLQAAQDVVRLAADTRKAWISAVAAQQSALYLREVKEAAEAGAELARRMARVGNWSRLEQAREQLLLAEATAQLARAQQAAFGSREKLIRLMGLWGAQTGFVLAERLPDLPKAAVEMRDIEAQALRERLDVRAAVARTGYIARQEGFDKVAGYFDGLALSYTRNTTFDNASGSKSAKRGWELELPLPLFDWGGARHARSKAVYLQSTAQVRAVAIQARSEAREASFAYRTAFDLAMHYRDEVVPLRKFILEEQVLRYNGMLASVWDLLAETRQQTLAVNSAIEAQRDFWLAEADMQTALTGTSPGALASLSPGASAEPTQGH